MFAQRPIQDPFQSHKYSPFNNHMITQKDLLQREKQSVYPQSFHQPYEQEPGQQSPPHIEHNNMDTGRRKRSFHFEPEFYAALDASLNEPSSTLPRPHPIKKLRRSATATDPTILTNNNIPNNITTSSDRLSSTPTTLKESNPLSSTPRRPPLLPKYTRRSQGNDVRIVDLSSGEELSSSHLGEKEHKRRRESTADSLSSADSLREIFDVLEDGTLKPVMDHAPSLPSPYKRSRIHRSMDNSSSRDSGDGDDSPLEIISEPRNELQSNTTKKDRTSDDDNHGQFSQYSNSNTYRDDQSESSMMMDQDNWDNATPQTPKPSQADLGALIRYEGPKTVTLADGVDALIRKQWLNRYNTTPELSDVQGNELVLYRRPPPTFLSSSFDYEDDDTPEFTARITEIDDDKEDDGYASHDSANDDSHVQELEDKIMGMDLD
ncbi:hypothetical protein BX616_011240 [Lobosporangium transversale]|uniref:Uncharacterized protein n=1 Tax=Lobosporangium transversale TaxID=64571 RepID=A0A1Y2GSC9_9FUNG|nr:hypothetical protein BCR41DRAFT_352293 [Lobosporangium transversale]KAF9909282.1 hypothetical protein BX616_011240 [Lobosporangium transversale]ORZ18385.1 hypothetical protein BCR41DRAFT_352293 [Lobosporangium transversale]|eukprot:XP_021882180.1 hypothetical protein BCR41DRAFT_352293 [Lobosporangium transversale]